MHRRSEQAQKILILIVVLAIAMMAIEAAFFGSLVPMAEVGFIAPIYYGIDLANEFAEQFSFDEKHVVTNENAKLIKIVNIVCGILIVVAIAVLVILIRIKFYYFALGSGVLVGMRVAIMDFDRFVKIRKLVNNKKLLWWLNVVVAVITMLVLIGLAALNDVVFWVAVIGIMILAVILKDVLTHMKVKSDYNMLK